MIDVLANVFKSAFEEFLKTERDNILNGTSERNLCARLAPKLEKFALENGFDNYFADVEYNRKQEGKVKTIIDENYEIVSIVCDLILHSRGNSILNDNLIAIEMKRNNRPAKEKNKDRIRLRAMTKSSYDDIWSNDGTTHPEHVCGYALGYYVELDENNCFFLIEEYQEGAIVRKYRYDF